MATSLRQLSALCSGPTAEVRLRPQSKPWLTMFVPSSAVPTCPPPAAATSDASREALDGVYLCGEFRHPAPTLQYVPPFMRATVRNAPTTALARLRAAHAASQGNAPTASRAWKLFLLAPRMLLARKAHKAGPHSLRRQRRSSGANGHKSSPPRGPIHELTRRGRNRPRSRVRAQASTGVRQSPPRRTLSRSASAHSSGARAGHGGHVGCVH